MGCGSGMTPYQVRGRLCWRRLRDWQQAGVWQKLHESLLSRLHGADRLDRSRACVDSASVRAVGGGEKDRPQSHGPGQIREQASRAHRGQRNTSVCHPDRGQSPRRNPAVVPVSSTGQALVEGVPPVRGQWGRPRRRPQRLYADRAYDSRQHRRNCAGVTSRRPWLGGARNTAAGWECTAGWWNRPCGGCTSSAGCGCATSAAPTFMKPSCPSGVRSSASDAGPLSVRACRQITFVHSAMARIWQLARNEAAFLA